MTIQPYILSDDKKNVTFSINLNNFELPSGVQLDSIKEIFVTASFTAWRKKDQFAMQQQEDKSLWTLTKALDQVEIPGNIGFPEFNFLIFTDSGTAFNIGAKTPVTGSNLPCEEVFDYNFVILKDKKYLSEIKSYGDNLLKIQSLKDYDVKNPEDQALISNVRKVPHTNFLWRGYHPYIKSRPAFDTEDLRLKLVNKAIKKNKIKSIITLCGNEKPQKGLNEKISRYIRNIQKKGNQLFLDTTYETVYFASDSMEYSNTVRQIIDFIISHPAPFYIHCRLGSDRTGTMSSILAALCGASWEEIKADYEMTSKAGFGEFRSARLLEHSYKNLLGMSPSQFHNLQKEVEDYFTERNILSHSQIEKLRDKLINGN